MRSSSSRTSVWNSWRSVVSLMLVLIADESGESMNAQVQDLIAMLRAAVPPDAPRMWQLPAAEARRRGDGFFLMLNHGGPDMAEQRDLALPGRRCAIPARLYVPRTAAAVSPGLLYLHG